MLRMTRRPLLSAPAVLLARLATTAETVAESTPVSAAPYPLDLPADDRIHDEIIEWWYFTGHLATDADHRYGFEYVFFRADPGPLVVYAVHLAITDHERQTFVFDQKLDPGEALVDGWTGELALQIDDWTLTMQDGVAHLVAGLDGYAIDLVLMPAKPAALHDGDGFIQYDEETWTYYYSRTRIDASGSVKAGGDEKPVTGTAWFDHQWGQFDFFRTTGWDWFALQLDDGRDVMVYALRSTDNGFLRVDGTVIAPDGSSTSLASDEIGIEAMESWQSPATGIVWPSGWRLTIPSIGLDVDLTPVLVDQELDTLSTTGVIYWEGEVIVSGDNVAGFGYVELTGYDSRSSFGEWQIPDS